MVELYATHVHICQQLGLLWVTDPSMVQPTIE